MACQAAAVEEKMTLGSWTGNQKTEVVVVVEAAVADGAGHDGWCGYDCDYLALVVWYVCPVSYTHLTLPTIYSV